MKLSEAPKPIQDHYAGREREVASVRTNNASANHEAGTRFTITLVAFGAKDVWEFTGERGARRWTLKR